MMDKTLLKRALKLQKRLSASTFTWGPAFASVLKWSDEDATLHFPITAQRKGCLTLRPGTERLEVRVTTANGNNPLKEPTLSGKVAPKGLQGWIERAFGRSAPITLMRDATVLKWLRQQVALLGKERIVVLHTYPRGIRIGQAWTAHLNASTDVCWDYNPPFLPRQWRVYAVRDGEPVKSEFSSLKRGFHQDQTAMGRALTLIELCG